MKNSDKLRRTIDKDIDLSNIRNEIIEKMEYGDKMKKKNYLWKWSLVPICLGIVLGGVIFLNKDSKMEVDVSKVNLVENDNVELYINDTSKSSHGALKYDADVKIVRDVDVPDYKEIESIKIPSDLDDLTIHEIYVKPSRDSKEYNILQNYVFNYANKDDSRRINLSFSKKNKPIRDYLFGEEGSKESKINDVNLKIFKYNDIYFTEFKYNDINFDIETNGLTEKEFVDLLLSIIK